MFAHFVKFASEPSQPDIVIFLCPDLVSVVICLVNCVFVSCDSLSSIFVLVKQLLKLIQDATPSSLLTSGFRRQRHSYFRWRDRSAWPGRYWGQRWAPRSADGWPWWQGHCRDHCRHSILFMTIRHFSGFWNLVDLSVLSIVIIGTITRIWNNGETNSSRCILSVGSVLVWFKVLNFMRPFKHSGPLSK